MSSVDENDNSLSGSLSGSRLPATGRSRLGSSGSASSASSTASNSRHDPRSKRGSVFLKKAGFQPPTEHASTQAFDSMESMLSQDYAWHSSLTSHVAALGKRKEKGKQETATLTDLEKDIEALAESMRSMKDIREGYSPSKFSSVLDRVSSSRKKRRESVDVSSASSGGSGGGGSEGKQQQQRMRTPTDMEQVQERANEQDGDGADIEVKPTNRYPLRKQASAVAFAAKLVLQRKSKMEALANMERDVAEADMKVRVDALKNRKKTMTLGEWKERREAASQEEDDGGGGRGGGGRRDGGGRESPAKPAEVPEKRLQLMTSSSASSSPSSSIFNRTPVLPPPPSSSLAGTGPVSAPIAASLAATATRLSMPRKAMRLNSRRSMPGLIRRTREGGDSDSDSDGDDSDANDEVTQPVSVDHVNPS